jgi:hypothetical protein
MGKRAAILQIHHSSPLFWGGIENQRWVYDAVSAKDMDLFVLTDATPSWLWDLLPAERVGVTDLYDPAELLRKAQAIASQHALVGVITYAEEFVPQCAAVAEALSLPGIGEVAARRSSMDKIRMRECLAAESVPCPRFLIARSPEELREAASILGCPTVVKPRCGGGSVAVIRMESSSQAEEVYANVEALARPSVDPIFRSFDGTFLVEEYIPGRVLSVDGFIQTGRPFVVGMTDTRMSEEPCFYQEGCWTIDLIPACCEVAELAVEALGFDSGCFHCEVREGPNGPVVLEVAARLPGELIVPMYKAATGVDLLELAIDVAVGVVPRVTVGPLKRFSGAHAWFPNREGTMLGYRGVEDVLRDPRVSRLLLHDVLGEPAVPFNPYAVAQLDAPSLDRLLVGIEEVRSLLDLRIAEGAEFNE